MKLLEFSRFALMRSSRAFVWSATACGLIVLFAFFAAVGYDFYRTTLSMNKQVATNVAALAAQDIARNIALYDLSIQSVVEGIADPDILYQEPGLRQKILFDKSATAPGLGTLAALDEKGDIFLDLVLPDLIRSFKLGFGLEEACLVLFQDLGVPGPKRGHLVLILELGEIPS